jgi:hypothetical protein
VRGIGLKIGTLGDRAIPRCTLRHEEKGPNPSKPTGLGVNQGPPRVPHGRGKVLLKDRAKKTEEPRDRGKRRAAAAVRRRERKGRAGGEEMGKRNNCGGLIYRSKKKHCRYYRLQGPVPPAGQRPARGILRDFGIPVLPGFGRYHRQGRKNSA